MLYGTLIWIFDWDFGRRLSRWLVPYYTEEEQRELLASVLSSRADDQARLTTLAVEL